MNWAAAPEPATEPTTMSGSRGDFTPGSLGAVAAPSRGAEELRGGVQRQVVTQVGAGPVGEERDQVPLPWPVTAHSIAVTSASRTVPERPAPGAPATAANVAVNRATRLGD